MADIYSSAPISGRNHRQDEILPSCAEEQAVPVPEELNAAVDHFATLDKISRAAVMDLVKEMLQERFPELADKTEH
ncbi:MAG: Hypothetical protein BHV28_09860 [Candidatus Tokpelaia hoelldobleri]|uniref:Uncharacterized protein n=1 Tax=Candidatus Tokpelaia hoelldobleri TaxID=1902579 RepID=A0A1U9JUZ8_9HYPH|nr:MAG: Hypothetical protein BHV28_09860 [Candidatus Tokpelaia hoelldoblerii]